MIALYIILGILLLLFLIMLIRVQVFASYTDELRLSVKVLFFRLTILPAPPKKPKKKKPEKKPKEKKPEAEKTVEEPEKKEKKPFLSRLKEKKGLTGLVELFTGLAEIAAGMLKKLFSHIVIHKLDVGISVSSGDAASTAVTYGKLCSAVYPAINVITAATKCKDWHVTVEPVFDDEKTTEVYADLHAHLRIIFAVAEAIKAGIKLLWLRMKL